MALQKTVFKPGINREGTDYSNEGGWFDVNLVRLGKDSQKNLADGLN
jgi:hypothetical protein